jgi:hypothetical protein
MVKPTFFVHSATLGSERGFGISPARRIALQVILMAAVTVGSVALAGSSMADILAQSDFGTVEGTNVSPFSTQYLPLPDAPTSPGHYSVAKSAAGHSWSAWDWGGQDHTNPGTGCFMVIDGSQDSAQVLLSYTTNAVAGYKYILSGWAQFLSGTAGPSVDLSFRVDGVQHDTFSLSGDTAWLWREFSFTYIAVTSGPTVFALHDNSTNSAWNDFGLDDVAFSAHTIPEPSTLVGLLSMGIVGLGLAWWRCRRTT